MSADELKFRRRRQNREAQRRFRQRQAAARTSDCIDAGCSPRSPGADAFSHRRRSLMPAAFFQPIADVKGGCRKPAST